MNQMVKLIVLLSSVATIALATESKQQGNEIFKLFEAVDVSSSQTSHTSPTKPTLNASHIVEKSDTMYHISKLYGISLSELYKINNMKENDAITIGSHIKISNNRTTPEIKKDKTHTTKKESINQKKINDNTPSVAIRDVIFQSNNSSLSDSVLSFLRINNNNHIKNHSQIISEIVKHSKLLFPEKSQIVALSMSAKLKVESDFDPKAIVISPREHSVGLFQVQIKTAKELASHKELFKNIDPELYNLLSVIDKTSDRQSIENLLFVQKNNIMTGIGYEYLLSSNLTNSIKNGTIDAESYNHFILNSLKKFKVAYSSGKIKGDSIEKFPTKITPELDSVLHSFFTNMYATTSKYNGGMRNDKYVWKTATAIVQLHYAQRVEKEQKELALSSGVTKIVLADNNRNKPKLS